MTDLDAAIRARLGIEPQGLFAKTITKGTVTHVIGLADWAREADAALLAVLDLHKPRSAGIPNKPHIMDCSVCMDVGPEVCSPVGYPCETVEAIAEKLGVEVDGE